MDVSIIDEMPAGRKVIETYWAKHDMLDRVLGFVEKEIKRKTSICYLSSIEESEKLDVQNAIDLHSMLTHHYQGKCQVGLMHGRLSSQEKEEIMGHLVKIKCKFLYQQQLLK